MGVLRPSDLRATSTSICLEFAKNLDPDSQCLDVHTVRITKKLSDHRLLAFSNPHTLMVVVGIRADEVCDLVPNTVCRSKRLRTAFPLMKLRKSLQFGEFG